MLGEWWYTSSQNLQFDFTNGSVGNEGGTKYKRIPFVQNMAIVTNPYTMCKQWHKTGCRAHLRYLKIPNCIIIPASNDGSGIGFSASPGIQQDVGYY